MVWGLWNWNTQQSTTQIDGQPLLFRIWAWKLNNTMDIYQSTCGWIFVELGLIFEAKYYCNGLGGLGFGKCNNPPLKCPIRRPLCDSKPKNLVALR
jgi:hypothetical protein